VFCVCGYVTLVIRTICDDMLQIITYRMTLEKNTTQKVSNKQVPILYDREVFVS
jgi:hypothetical protein